MINERGHLRVEIDRLERQSVIDRESQEVQRREKMEMAVWARERGLMRAEAGDFQAALAEFERALRLGPSDWSERDRIERDAAAIREMLGD